MSRQAAEGAPRAGLIQCWLPVLVYLAVIFILSAQPNLQPPFQFEYSDKVCHLIEYGGLGVLVTRALRIGSQLSWPAAVAGAAIALCALTGVADELFQRSVPGRESSVFDWMADAAGASLGSALYGWMLRSGWSWL